GATVWEILLMFNRKFFILTFVCSMIAIFMSYKVTVVYFSTFTYHYDINIWVFIIGVLIAMVMSVLVVCGASYRAANENPVDTLKSE
ncbi:MAG: ABC transporter permease, partial [Bacteroidales bacterium]|nr:ABC transporter permease [Bacteroidales bacterium]